MAYLIDNDFALYSLSDEELTQGSILTITQRQVLQNQLSVLASEKLGLEPDTKNFEQYLQQEAHLRGQIDNIRYLLDQSIAAEEAARIAAENR